MEISLREHEIECVKRMATAFEKGNLKWNLEDNDYTKLGLTRENFRATLLFLREYDYIDSSDADFLRFVVKPSILHLEREIEEAQRKKSERDVVEIIKNTFRRHPVTAWIFVAVTGITFLATAITQIAGALKALGISH